MPTASLVGDLDWVYVWGAGHGRLMPGARHSTFNDRPVSAHPRTDGIGILWAVRSPIPPRFGERIRLRDQGSISRGACYSWGLLTHAYVIPATSSEQELGAPVESGRLMDLADEAVRAERSSLWAPALIGFSRRQVEAVAVGEESWAMELARVVAAPAWIEVRDDAGLRVMDRRGRIRRDTGPNLSIMSPEGECVRRFLSPATFHTVPWVGRCGAVM